MAKRIVLTFLQFVAFFGLMFLGGNWDVLNLSYELRQMQAGNFHPHALLLPTIKYPMGRHILIANGILFCIILLVLILAVEAIRKSLTPWALYSLLAFAFAVIIALSLKMGLPPASTPDNSSITTHLATHV